MRLRKRESRLYNISRPNEDYASKRGIQKPNLSFDVCDYLSDGSEFEWIATADNCNMWESLGNDTQRNPNKKKNHFSMK